MLNNEETEKLDCFYDKYKEEIIKLRRDFHKYPETCWLEFRTTAIIAKYLEDNGLQVFMGNDVIDKKAVVLYPNHDEIENAMSRAVSEGADSEYVKRTNGYTGIMAVIDTGREGPVTAFRFDIDSNCVDESMNDNHRPKKEGFSSIHRKMAHCCGHDGHASIGIITATILNEMKDSLCGKLKFIFQPAEEGVLGAAAMISKGILDDVDNFFAGHIAFKALDINTIMTGTYGFLATQKIDAEFIGDPSHAGSAPQNGKNALLAASMAILAMHTFAQDGRGVARVNVGTIHAGTGRNVIPEKAKIQFEVRGETNQIANDLKKKCIEALKSAAKMYDTEVDIILAGKADNCDSDPILSNLVADVAKRVLPNINVVTRAFFGGSEDATLMMNVVRYHGGKSTYSMFGTEIKAPHHNGSFDFNEDVLMNGVKIHTNCAFEVNGK